MSSVRRSLMAVGLCFAVVLLLPLNVQAEKNRICGARLTKMLISICTPKDAVEACFKGGFADPAGFAKREKWILPKWLLDKKSLKTKRSSEGVATECCEKGCDYQYMKSFCCES